MGTGSNVRYAIGALASRIEHGALGSPLFPLTRYVPRGRSWLYDVQRISGSKRLGVVVDAGANIGQTAGDVLRYDKRAEIHCFEPAPATFAALERNYGGRVHCHNLALGRADGSLRLTIAADSLLSTFAVLRPEAGVLKHEDVPVRSLDSFCAEHNIARVDVLKMDVQGWEGQVIAGAQGMIARRAVGFIFAEVGFRARTTDMQPFGAFNDEMDRLGFEFCGLYDNFRVGPAKGYVAFADALYALGGTKGSSPP